MQIASVFVVALLSAVVTGQHLLIAGGGLDKDSGFFWDRLIQLAVTKLSDIGPYL